MKSRPFSALLPLLLCLAACSSTPHRGGGTASVQFVEPQNYTDLRLRTSTREESARQLLPDLEAYIKKDAAKYLPAGEHLDMRITDIDEEGWIRPLGPNPRRIVHQSQPATIEFNYTLNDAAGATLQSGHKKLSELPIDFRLDRSFDYEQMPLIKQMLHNWIYQLGRK